MYSKRMNLRDEVLAMKRIVLALVALLVGLVPAKSQTAPGQPAPGVSNTVQQAMKLTIRHPWEDTTILLFIPASPEAPGRTENLKARRAGYADSGQRQGWFSIVAAENPPYQEDLHRR